MHVAESEAPPVHTIALCGAMLHVTFGYDKVFASAAWQQAAGDHLECLDPVRSIPDDGLAHRAGSGPSKSMASPIRCRNVRR
jgi:hypothetical protein